MWRLLHRHIQNCSRVLDSLHKPRVLHDQTDLCPEHRNSKTAFDKLLIASNKYCQAGAIRTGRSGRCSDACFQIHIESSKGLVNRRHGVNIMVACHGCNLYSLAFCANAHNEYAVALSAFARSSATDFLAKYPVSIKTIASSPNDCQT